MVEQIWEMDVVDPAVPRRLGAEAGEGYSEAGVLVIMYAAVCFCLIAVQFFWVYLYASKIVHREIVRQEREILSFFSVLLILEYWGKWNYFPPK
jgi:hypothetical protein